MGGAVAGAVEDDIPARDSLEASTALIQDFDDLKIMLTAPPQAFPAFLAKKQTDCRQLEADVLRYLADHLLDIKEKEKKPSEIITI